MTLAALPTVATVLRIEHVTKTYRMGEVSVQALRGIDLKRVDAAMVVWESKDVVRVPTTALFRAGDRWALFVVEDGRARTVPVDIGASDGTWTAVISGIAESAMVIVQPSDSIQDGKRVLPRQRAELSRTTAAAL